MRSRTGHEHELQAQQHEEGVHAPQRHAPHLRGGARDDGGLTEALVGPQEFFENVLRCNWMGFGLHVNISCAGKGTFPYYLRTAYQCGFVLFCIRAKCSESLRKR